jgi:hypothetical protein
MITQEEYEKALDLIKTYERYQRYDFNKICCVCKKAKIKTLYPTSNIKKAMWDSGIVTEIQAGFGSCHDMNTFLIAICDDCITDLHNLNIIEKVNVRS